MKLPTPRTNGFTLVEIMIVVVIVGILAGIAIPTFLSIRMGAQVTRVSNDYRTFATAFEIHAFELGYWPADVDRGVIPPTMVDYLKGEAFANTTPIGGNWDWDFEHADFYAGISLVDPTADESVFIKIDEALDDGNLSTGKFRRTAPNRYTFILEEW